MDSRDDIIEAYKSGVDRTLLRENLRRTPEERLRQLQMLQRFASELRRAGRQIGERPARSGTGKATSPRISSGPDQKH